jgi:hypothetical protein
MNLIRIVCLAFLAGAYALAIQAQSETLCTTALACERTRIETQDIYMQGVQRLAPRWHGLRTLDDAAVFIRSETSKAEKGHVSVWLDRELVAPRYHEKEMPYLSMRERFVVDCNARQLGLAEWAYYSERFGEGQVVTRNKSGQAELNSPLPDSLEEQVVGIACPQKQRKTSVAKKKKTPKAESSSPQAPEKKPAP